MPFFVLAMEGVAPRSRSPARGRGADARGARWTVFRRVTLPLVAAVARGGRRARLGARARRVRRDDHVRRQLPRPYADDPARGLPRAREPSRGRHGAEPRAARRLAHHPHRHARSLARAAMSLEARVHVRRGTFDLEVDAHDRRRRDGRDPGPERLPARRPSCTRWRGSSPWTRAGSTVDGIVLEDPSAGIAVPAEERPVAVVFQSLLLFPHLSALENIAFGLRCHGRPRGEARRIARQWLERMGLGDRARSKPSALSGGQAQRVALARALAVEPRLLLLDEPLAAVDVQGRAQLRRDLRKHLASFDGVRLLVTHDPLEAFALADRVIVLERGRVVQRGTAADGDRPSPLPVGGRPGRRQPVPRHGRGNPRQARRRRRADRGGAAHGRRLRRRASARRGTAPGRSPRARRATSGSARSTRSTWRGPSPASASARRHRSSPR